MNEDRKKRGLAHSKFLTVVAMSALFLSSGNVMATQVASDNVLEVTEQLQSIKIRSNIKNIIRRLSASGSESYTYYENRVEGRYGITG